MEKKEEKNTKGTTKDIRRNKEKKEMDRLEQSKYGYELVNAWIANADNKVSVSCGIFTGVFGVINFLADKYVKIPNDPSICRCWQIIYHITFVGSIIAMGLAILFYVLAISPNLKSNSKESVKKCPLYYGDIEKLTYETYLNQMNNASEEDWIEELQRDTRCNAEICMKKMQKYKIALWASCIGIGLALAAWGSHYLMYRC